MIACEGRKPGKRDNDAPEAADAANDAFDAAAGMGHAGPCDSSHSLAPVRGGATSTSTFWIRLFFIFYFF